MNKRKAIKNFCIGTFIHFFMVYFIILGIGIIVSVKMKNDYESFSLTSINGSSLTKKQDGIYIEDDEPIQYTWGHKVTRNSFGMRDKEYNTTAASGTFRIMVIGDSFSWGAGISVKDRYATLLENKLNENLYLLPPSFKNAEVVTFSTGGGNSKHYFSLLEEYGEIISPNLVVIGLTYNDTAQKGWLDDPTLKFFTRKIIKPFCNLVALTDPFDYFDFDKNLLVQAFTSLAEKFGIINNPYEAIFEYGYNKNSKNWIRFAKDLVDISALSHALTGQKPIAITLTPSLNKRGPSYFSKNTKDGVLVEKMINSQTKASEEAGFKVANSLPVFKVAADGKYLSVNYFDGHPNEFSNTLYSEVLYDAVVQSFKLKKN